MALLTADYHVYPDYHGNRSPLADPAMTGALCGLTLDCGVRQLARAYLATIQGGKQSLGSTFLDTVSTKLSTKLSVKMGFMGILI